MRVHLNHVLLVGGMAIVSLQSQLLLLVAKWRKYGNAPESEFGANGPWEAGEQIGFLACADELEALIQPKLGVCPECGGAPDYLGAYCTECGAKKQS